MRRQLVLCLILALAAPTVAVFSQTPAITVTRRARAVRPGELVVLTVATRVPAESLAIDAFGRALVPHQAGPGSWRVLVGIDVSTTPGKYPVAIEAGSATATHMLVVAPRTFPTRTLRVDPAFVTPPPEAAERIASEARRLAELWTLASEPLWEGPFVRPVPHAANSAFGTYSVFNGERRGQHGGADFRSPAGTPIRAPNAGRVVLADDLYYSGGTVVIDHGGGLLSLFAHLSRIEAEEGTLVKKGDAVGEVGATGRVTGPHLHWAVRVGGARVDPLSLLAVLGPARPPKR
ncbi:MAG TPA: M23 family metallopeptidase [Vicinamibacterales bacterium]|nr:M23 family metallopeptidase [Vicinamibacterales bacterium]